MTRSGLIVLLCLFLTSGCALFDSQEVTSDQPSATPPAVEGQAEPTPVEAAPVETPTVAARNFTHDDVRRMQQRLREVGLDPGPIDGIAGARTKAAFGRFQIGCQSANGVIERWAGAASPFPPVEAKIPDPQETRMIQTQLRSAGFNPGPIDGIFGSKTRSLLAQLKESCPMVGEFTQMLDQAVSEASRSAGGLRDAQNSGDRLELSRVLARSDAAKAPSAPQPARSQEEIRILQLQLRDAGFDPGPFDGIMGPKTRLALQQYQASRKGKTAKLVSGVGGQY
jgi:peptidoglycan hydrolase-like protein with peptidoglycan-binding domain